MSTSILTKKEILAAEDHKVEVVHVKEWGGDVRIRTMTGKERDEFEAAIGLNTISGEGEKTRVDPRGLRVKLLSLTLVDEHDNLLFTAKDIQALNGKAAKPLSDLFQVAQKLNGLGDEEMEELAKN